MISWGLWNWLGHPPVSSEVRIHFFINAQKSTGPLNLWESIRLVLLQTLRGRKSCVCWVLPEYSGTTAIPRNGDKRALDVSTEEGTWRTTRAGFSTLATQDHLDTLSNDKIQAPPRTRGFGIPRVGLRVSVFQIHLSWIQGTERLRTTALASLLSYRGTLGHRKARWPLKATEGVGGRAGGDQASHLLVEPLHHTLPARLPRSSRAFLQSFLSEAT